MTSTGNTKYKGQLNYGFSNSPARNLRAGDIVSGFVVDAAWIWIRPGQRLFLIDVGGQSTIYVTHKDLERQVAGGKILAGDHITIENCGRNSQLRGYRYEVTISRTELDIAL